MEGTDNKLTKSYTNLTCDSFPFNIRPTVTIILCSFGAIGMLSKKNIFVTDIFKLLPRGFTTWFLERDRRPGMVKVRENRKYAHEVAVKLIEDKKQELRNGTSRKDLLSLLGSSFVSHIENQYTPQRLCLQSKQILHCDQSGDCMTKKLLPKLGEATCTTSHSDDPRQSAAQDDHVFWTRDYGECGQLFQTFQLLANLSRLDVAGICNLGTR